MLYEETVSGAGRETPEAPAFFADLNLDQVVSAITHGKEEYHLEPFFFTPLHDADAIHYRHEVFQDLEDGGLLEDIRAFAQRMIAARRSLALLPKLDFMSHREGWFLEAALVYCEAVSGLARDLAQAHLRSRGFLAFRAYLANYASSEGFMMLAADAQRVKAALAAIEFCMEINGLRVKVRKYEGETDYSAEVEKTFAKFRQGEVKDYHIGSPTSTGMNYVEAQIVACVAKLYPEVFSDLREFCARHTRFLDETVRAFDREVQFYVAYLEFVARFKQAGLRFCYPETVETREIHSREGFDIALANRLVQENAPVICNDWYLQGMERVIVVSGPNQGGKTTFARAFGQLHYLGSIGCPIPGREARLALFDRLLTHFEKEEDIKNLRGKLQDDLIRIHAILEQATPRSILILNEVFSSTTLQDAIFLSQEIMARIVELDCLCVWVTFVDEMASFSEKTVSMVSTVVRENPAQRTFRIIRKPADGLAYALSIAEKHRVTYEQIMERIQP
jgi:hypothetical protein